MDTAGADTNEKVKKTEMEAKAWARRNVNEKKARRQENKNTESEAKRMQEKAGANEDEAQP